jgi:ABC-type lipoprotein export system ATPase subunit
MSEVLRAVDVARTYDSAAGGVLALEPVSVSLDRNEWLAVTGPSGSGKTTLLNLLGGLDRPSSGQVRFEGADLASFTSDQLASYRQKSVGFVFQSYRLLPYLSALDNVALPSLLAGTRTRDAHAKARLLLERLGLSRRATHRPAQLSGGEQQRIAVARAMVNAPTLLLADEPTGNLDARSATELMDLLAELHRTDGLALVVATHNQQVAARADRSIELRAGHAFPMLAQ